VSVRHARPRKRASKGVMTVLGGYKLDMNRGGVLVHEHIDTSKPGDYGADPIGDGTFRMVPSGDVVTLDERNRRLNTKEAKP
jgi:hypothetical protein